VIRKDLMTLSVKVSSIENWETEALEHIKSKLYSELSGLDKNQIAEAVLVESAEEHFIRLWLHFLQTGHLPPLASGFDLKTLENPVLFTQFQNIGDFKHQLQEILSSPAAQIRFFQSTSSKAFEHVAIHVLGIPGHFIAELETVSALIVDEQDLKDSLASDLPKENLKRLGFLCVLLQQGQRIGSFTVSDQHAAATHWIGLLKETGLDPDQLNLSLPEGSIKHAVQTYISGKHPDQPKEKKVEGKKIADMQPSDMKKTTHTPDVEEIIQQTLNKLRRKKNEVEQHLHTDDVRSIEKTPIETIERDGLFVENAGMVIVCPLLPTFFDRIGVYSKSEGFTDTDLAIAALHYVSFGRDHAEEYELGFEKFICGLDLKEPLVFPKLLPEEIKQECDELLISVIEHWAVLKNTSPEGLREAFLQRNGKLQKTQTDEFLLRVQQKSYDMLLEQLPWSIALISFPWMKSLLKVEWV
jgi:hypothetical protein